MKRALLVGAFLLLSLGAAQLLLPLSVPNTFQTGDNMSASAMNANLQAVYDRVAALHEAVSEAREAHANLRDRLDNLGPEAIEASATKPGEFTNQQTGTLPWPFKAGDIVDADAVNESFAVLVAEASAMQAELTGHHTDLLAFADTLAEAEQAHGLPSTPWPDTELQAYSDPAVTSFVKNQRAVPAELNSNFANLVAAIEVLEANSAALAAWASNDLERVEAIEAAAGPDLPSSAYQLRVSGTLNDGEFSDATEIWYTVVTSTTSTGSRTSRPPDRNGFPIAASGNFDFNIDARDLNAHPGALTPVDLVNLYLPVYDPSYYAREFTLSDPSAEVHAVERIAVLQYGAVNTGLYSHEIRFTHNDGPYPMIGRLVFSDRPVTIQGTMTSTLTDLVRRMDVALAAGWNIIYPSAQPVEPRTVLYHGSSVTGLGAPLLTDTLFDFGQSYEAELVLGYALFPAHETSGESEPTPMFYSTRASGQPYLAVNGPAWVSHDRAPHLLVPIEDLDPTVAPGQITSDDPDARFLAGVLAAYDQVGADGGQIGVYDARFADIDLISESGNFIIPIYADRSVTVFADMTVPGDPSQGTRTDPGGLELNYGWNLLELVPDEPGSMLRTLRRYSGELPTVEFFVLNP